MNEFKNVELAVIEAVDSIPAILTRDLANSVANKTAARFFGLKENEVIGFKHAKNDDGHCRVMVKSKLAVKMIQRNLADELGLTWNDFVHAMDEGDVDGLGDVKTVRLKNGKNGYVVNV